MGFIPELNISQEIGSFDMLRRGSDTPNLRPPSNTRYQSTFLYRMPSIFGIRENKVSGAILEHSPCLYQSSCKASLETSSGMMEENKILRNYTKEKSGNKLIFSNIYFPKICDFSGDVGEGRQNIDKKRPGPECFQNRVRFNHNKNKTFYINGKDFYKTNDIKHQIWWSSQELNFIQNTFMMEVSKVNKKSPNKTRRECILELIRQDVGVGGPYKSQ